MRLTYDEMVLNRYMEQQGLAYSKYSYIEDKMEKYKTEAVKRFYTICHPDFAEAFASTIAYGFDNNVQSAKQIVKELDLSDKHIAALIDDEKMMKQILDEEIVQDGDYGFSY